MGKRNILEFLRSLGATDAQLQSLPDGEITAMNIDYTERTLHLTVAFSAPLTGEQHRRFCALLTRPALQLRAAELSPVYPPNTLSAAEFPELVRALAQKHISVSGIFKDAAARLEENTLTVTLRHGGYSVISARGLDQELVRLIAARYQRRVELKFDGSLMMEAGNPQYVAQKEKETVDCLIEEYMLNLKKVK